MSYYDAYPSVNVDALEPKEAQRRNAEAINYLLRRLRTPEWDDMRRPANAANIDSAATRYSYDYDEGVITFGSTARIANERIIFTFQMPHAWHEHSDVEPHLHWWQSTSAVPHWWMKWRKWNNSGDRPLTWTEAAYETAEVFPYSSGEICQITTFPAIDMSDINISGFVQIMFGRDSGDVSGLFGGAEVGPIATDYIEFDVHHLIDARGSVDLFRKVV